MRKTIHSDRGRLLAGMLREARERKGITMRDLADLLDWPHTVIAKIETAERRVDLVELEAICDALGISFIEFVRRYRHSEAPGSTSRHLS